jgi:hypothetical protein
VGVDQAGSDVRVLQVDDDASLIDRADAGDDAGENSDVAGFDLTGKDIDDATIAQH